MYTFIDKSMQIVLERGSINKSLNSLVCYNSFFILVCSPNTYMYACKVFSIQIFQYFRQIPPRVCTLVLFIYLCNIFLFFYRVCTSSHCIMVSIITSKCCSVGRAEPAARDIVQHSFYNFTLFPTLTFERSCWADI